MKKHHSKNHPPPQQTQQSRTQITMQSAGWSGPLPPPAALEHFDRVIPGGADRILRMAEKEQDARLVGEHFSLQQNSKQGKRGQWLAWITALTAIGASLTSSLMAAPWQVSVALVSVPVLGFIQAIVGRKK